MKITRAWAMPSKNTFSILPIKELVIELCNEPGISIDPFSNGCKYAMYTNDLDPSVALGMAM